MGVHLPPHTGIGGSGGVTILAAVHSLHPVHSSHLVRELFSQHFCGWSPACRRPLSGAPASTVAGKSACSSLATYRFPHRQAGISTNWFQEAVRDIVRHVERTPFLQLVQLGGVAPKFTTVPVASNVVPVPEVGVLDLLAFRAVLAGWGGWVDPLVSQISWTPAVSQIVPQAKCFAHCWWAS